MERRNDTPKTLYWCGFGAVPLTVPRGTAQIPPKKKPPEQWLVGVDRIVTAILRIFIFTKIDIFFILGI